MTLAYTAKFGLTTQNISSGVQKIDSSVLKIYDMTLVMFSI